MNLGNVFGIQIHLGEENHSLKSVGTHLNFYLFGSKVLTSTTQLSNQGHDTYSIKAAQIFLTSAQHYYIKAYEILSRSFIFIIIFFLVTQKRELNFLTVAED